MPELPPTGLPIEAVVGELSDALAASGTAVLVAEPGAGKTTVVPLRLLEAPWLGGRKVLVLEPRRVAARAAAARMASLLGERVGGTVGLRTRDETRIGRSTRVEAVTEGVMTRMVQRDPSLEGVGVVVFDEFHERSLHAELGLALALEVRRELRPDLALLVASATIDAAAVATMVGEVAVPAPVIEAPGRTHPVEIRWKPAPPGRRLEPSLAAAVDVALADGPGDVLVFLDGAAAIRRFVSSAEARLGAEGVDVLPLFGALSSADQDRALARSPAGRRRVVVATDLAETSLTVEGVTSVVDSGLARTPRFDPGSGMTRLVTVPISQSSADQRAGRAGREGPGIAIRLWSPAEHASRRPHAEPAMLQGDLAALVLELAVWGTDPHDAAFLDPPPPGALAAARRLLTQLGALDDRGRVTQRGRSMSEVPLHPRLARMVLAGVEAGEGRLACHLAALLDDRDVLSGRPDEVPTDLAVRLRLLDGRDGGHPLVDPGALARARRSARDLARRTGVPEGAPARGEAGTLVALAYPDRVARRRPGAGSGRFRLAAGGGAWMAPHDELADEVLVVAAELDGDRRDARIRLAAALDEEALVAASKAPVAERRRTVWDRERDEPAVEVVRHLDGVELSVRVEPATAGDQTTAALVEHVRRVGLGALGWSASSRALLDRMAFLHAHRPGSWPPVSEAHLLATLDEWLAPMLPGATRRSDLSRVDPAKVLAGSLDHGRRRELDRLAPTRLDLGAGGEAPIDYSNGVPEVSVAPQRLFGTTRHPSVVDGEVPVVLKLLSPAGRPVQITSDLPGFWAGSWSEVRKEMAGRYPKHPWPEDPATASPPTPRTRRR